MNIEQLAQYITDYCKNNHLRKVYICGNGGSGKTTLSEKIRDIALKYGEVNIIMTDDFMNDTTLRKNSIAKWTENGVDFVGRYTSSNFESYFLKNIYEIIYNIDHGINCFYFPKEYKEKNNIRQLRSNYFLTIIEGVGTAFLDKDNEKSLTIFLKCNQEQEIKRRKNRTKELNRDTIELYDEKRSSQYRVNVLKYEKDFDFVIINDENFNYDIINW